jgi:nucleotide-binding universal stress UspA family protein
MKKIVVGYDGSEHGHRALERALDLVDSGGTVTVVAAAHLHPTGARGVNPVSPDPKEEEQGQRGLDEARALLAEKAIEGRFVEGVGDPADVLVEEAREWGADLVVVGTRGLSLAKRMVIGSVSTKVVHHAECDVLVVR